MLNSAVLLYLTVAAVVVGKQETFRRYDLCGAASAEDDNGIFQAGFIETVDIFSRQFQSHVSHGSDIQLLDQRKEPHSFICPGLEAGEMLQG